MLALKKPFEKPPTATKKKKRQRARKLRAVGAKGERLTRSRLLDTRKTGNGEPRKSTDHGNYAPKA